MANGLVRVVPSTSKSWANTPAPPQLPVAAFRLGLRAMLAMLGEVPAARRHHRAVPALLDQPSLLKSPSSVRTPRLDWHAAGHCSDLAGQLGLPLRQCALHGCGLRLDELRVDRQDGVAGNLPVPPFTRAGPTSPNPSRRGGSLVRMAAETNQERRRPGSLGPQLPSFLMDRPAHEVDAQAL
ncbi:hypothetical protein [Streptomyces sp. SP18CS02]|uniref:hypothetical protein n=1 Tax=Streptomyces sp. SP18CS02 TaxID=3002531 RepID=UPI002E76D87C|nr:hypothetical protein [Streptomyces sp. SP18CS02]MEE1756424.1 hypothetical protein [Streptomyces sp. SP18CS02]